MTGGLRDRPNFVYPRKLSPQPHQYSASSNIWIFANSMGKNWYLGTHCISRNMHASSEQEWRAPFREFSNCWLSPLMAPLATLSREHSSHGSRDRQRKGASCSPRGLPRSHRPLTCPCASATQRRGKRVPSCQAARSSGWPWPGLWYGTHLSSSWTKPPVLWMQRASTW